MYGGVGYAIGVGFNPASPPNKAFAADGLDSPFFGVGFGTVSLPVSKGIVAAAEMRYVRQIAKNEPFPNLTR